MITSVKNWTKTDLSGRPASVGGDGRVRAWWGQTGPGTCALCKLLQLAPCMYCLSEIPQWHCFFGKGFIYGTSCTNVVDTLQSPFLLCSVSRNLYIVYSSHQALRWAVPHTVKLQLGRGITTLFFSSHHLGREGKSISWGALSLPPSKAAR